MSDYGAETGDFHSDFRAAVSDYASDFCDYPGDYGRAVSPGGEARAAVTDLNVRRRVCRAAPGNCDRRQGGAVVAVHRGKGAKRHAATSAQTSIARRITQVAI